MLPNRVRFPMALALVVVMLASLMVAVSVPFDATPRAVAQFSPRLPVTQFVAGRVNVGFSHGCAVSPTGAVQCWGRNVYGQLGDGTTTDSTTAVDVQLPIGWHAVAVAVGEHHSCALLTDGDVACWGDDAVGQLGAGVGTQGPSPVRVDFPAGRQALSISAGPSHTCAVVDNGAVMCWGNEQHGAVGHSTSPATIHSPQQVVLPGGATALAVSTSLNHTCAVLDTGAVTCWGDNEFGQFGIGVTSSATVTPSTPVLLDGRRAVGVSVGMFSTCALSDWGQVLCWGWNGVGQLGDGTTTERWTPTLAALPGGGRALAIAVGYHHACAVLAQGIMACWGFNGDGQIGDGTFDTQTTPAVVQVPAGRRAIAVATSHMSNCALFDGGEVSCWGLNTFGGLGDGTTTSASTPVTLRAVGSTHMVTQVAVGASHTCVVNTEGLLWCWGRNDDGQLGDGTTTERLTPGAPVTLPSSGRARSVTVGYHHTCALLTDGKVSCWGSNSSGQLGTGMNTLSRTTPSPPITLQSFQAKAISAGGSHTCALHDDGSIACWGYNAYGQLGDGGTNNQFSTHDVVWMPGGSTAVAVTTGLEHTCALKPDGAMFCWGRNLNGQLGDGSSVNRTSAVAVSVTAGVKATAIEAGRFHTCALLTGGEVTCWGDNYWGQLGTGTSGAGTNLSAPSGTVTLPGSQQQATALAVGDQHSCVVLDTGGASCWGYNAQGGVGDGSNINRSSPVLVNAQSGGVSLRSLGAGYLHTCAVLGNGTVSCWGSNTHGQLGDGTTVDRNAPNPITLTAPTGLTAVTGATGDTSVALTWTEPRSPYGPQTWFVEGSTDDTIWWPTTVATVAPSGTTVLGLTSGTPYRFRVTSTTPIGITTVTLAATVTLTAPDIPETEITDTPTTPAPTTLAPPTTAQIAALPLRDMVDPDALFPGATVTVTVDGFTPGENVMVVVASTPQLLTTVTANNDGEITTEAHIPADLDDEVHTFAVWAPETGRGFRQLFGPNNTADSDQTDPNSTELPATGYPSLRPFTVALILCFIGVMLMQGLTLNRRRSRITLP